MIAALIASGWLAFAIGSPIIIVRSITSTTTQEGR